MKKEVKKKKFSVHEHFFKRIFTSKAGQPPHTIDNWKQKVHPAIAITDGSIAMAAEALKHGVSASLLCARSRASVCTDVDPAGPSLNNGGENMGKNASEKVEASAKMCVQKNETHAKIYKDNSTMTSTETLPRLSNFKGSNAVLKPAFVNLDTPTKLVDVAIGTHASVNSLNFA